jgi:hypothetical protein
VDVPTPLSAVPPRKRRFAAGTLGLVAVLLTAVGTVAATGASSVSLQVFVAVVLLLALVFALTAWGLAHSVRLDSAAVAEREFDEVVLRAAGTSPESLCSCGHEHDPDELHVTDAPAGSGYDECAHDGRGAGCEHSCETCVLASLRPSPTTPRAERLPR